MKLYDLLKDVKIRCNNINLNNEIKGISSDSRQISKGHLFVAIKGEKRNGNDYIFDAIKKGAIAVVSQENNKYGNIPFIKVENDREALAKIWNAYYGYPTKNMKVIAFTGTNGKTSCVHLLKSILKSANKKYGVISTIGCEINGEKIDFSGGSEVSDIPSSMTTPDPKYLYEILYKMKCQNVEYVVMEASSHSLSQYKLSGMDIYIGAFTNLSSEHMDYHKNMEDYFECKKKLFKMCKFGIANIDSDYGVKLKNSFSTLKTVSLKSNADFYCENLILNGDGSHLDVRYCDEKVKIKSKLIGNFVPDNILLSVACACMLGIDKKYIEEGIYTCEYIDGRMEKIYENIFIDYAHTPKAIENVLTSVKQIFDKKITVLFGCGGDRDKSKRAITGKIVSKYADKVIITSDNSRTENKYDIIRDILEGVEKNKEHYVIPNRKEAIEFAIKTLNSDSILLLLGKGHEKYEIDSSGKHYFDEKEIVRKALNNV